MPIINPYIFGSGGNATTGIAADLKAGKTLNDGDGNTVTGTMPLSSPGSSVLTNQGQVVTFGAGYYDTGRTATANITNLTAANIRYGTTVGGVAGTFSYNTGAVAGDVMIGKTFVSNGNTLTGDGTKIPQIACLVLTSSITTPLPTSAIINQRFPIIALAVGGGGGGGGGAYGTSSIGGGGGGGGGGAAVKLWSYSSPIKQISCTIGNPGNGGNGGDSSTRNGGIATQGGNTIVNFLSASGMNMATATASGGSPAFGGTASGSGGDGGGNGGSVTGTTGFYTFLGSGGGGGGGGGGNGTYGNGLGGSITTNSESDGGVGGIGSYGGGGGGAAGCSGLFAGEQHGGSRGWDGIGGQLGGTGDGGIGAYAQGIGLTGGGGRGGTPYILNSYSGAGGGGGGGILGPGGFGGSNHNDAYYSSNLIGGLVPPNSGAGGGGGAGRYNAYGGQGRAGGSGIVIVYFYMIL